MEEPMSLEEFKDLQSVRSIDQPLPDSTTPLDFLRAVYCNPDEPMQRRMRAAEATLPFVHPKLAVTVSASGGFAAMMEDLSRRSGKSNVIDAKANVALAPRGPDAD